MSALTGHQVLGLIPARGGSKGIPRKNLTLMAGRPLVSYTFEQALLSQRVSRVVLSTDDEDIAALGRAAGVEVPFIRPAELAGDNATVESVVAHALDWLAECERYEPDAFVILQPTTPLRTASHIDGAVALFESSGADAVVSVSPPREHPCDMVYFEGSRMQFVLPKTGYSAGVQRQGYLECYFINGAIYVTKAEVFRRTGSRFGKTTVPFFMAALDSVDVDTNEDLAVVELLFRRRLEMRDHPNRLLEVDRHRNDPGGKC